MLLYAMSIGAAIFFVVGGFLIGRARVATPDVAVAAPTPDLESPASDPEPAPPLPRSADTPALLGEVVRRAASVESIAGVAITDTFGLAVAGSGDLVDELSAFGAHVARACSQASRHLPLDEIRAVIVRDRTGRTVVSQTLDAQSMSLVTLATGDEASAEIAELARQVHLEE